MIIQKLGKRFPDFNIKQQKVSQKTSARSNNPDLNKPCGLKNKLPSMCLGNKNVYLSPK